MTLTVTAQEDATTLMIMLPRAIVEAGLTQLIMIPMIVGEDESIPLTALRKYVNEVVIKGILLKTLPARVKKAKTTGRLSQIAVTDLALGLRGPLKRWDSTCLETKTAIQ